MEKQRLRIAARRMGAAHAVFWTIYSVIVILFVPRLYHAEGFDAWPLAARLGVALAPVLPIALWLYASFRFLARMPDEMLVQQTTRATAVAGAVTVLVLFAQGWIDLIAGPDVWPRLVFEGFDTTPWLFVFLFLGVWTIAVNIQKKSVEG
jgi:hypothetical protein